MKAVMWVVFTIIGMMVVDWLLRNGINANANFNAQMNPNGWGSGMIYAPGSASQWQYMYGGKIPAWALAPQNLAYYKPATPFAVSLDPNSINFQYGY